MRLRRARLAVAQSLLLFPAASLCLGQQEPGVKEILERLERLEQQNRELAAEVKSLKAQLAERKAAAPPESTPQLEERVAVQERRLEEQEQTKVSAEQRFPLSLTGTILFNGFYNGRSNGNQYPTTAPVTAEPGVSGASFRQTILGLRYDGPEVFRGAKVSGVAYFDLFGGSGTSLDTLARLRVASIDLSWKNTTLSFAHEKPIMAPREPETLAQMGVSPLTAAGNLWLWQPQLKLEHRVAFGAAAGLKAQAGIYQTQEASTGLPASIVIDRSRPGYEGRFEVWSQMGEKARIEIAPGFHISDTHVLGGPSVPSRIFSLDWMIRPAGSFDFSGAFFNGRNVSVLGSSRQGITVMPDGRLRAVEAMGGWAQLAFRPTSRLTFNFYSGQADYRNADLLRGAIAKNLVYAGNFIYRIGTNVLASFEASQTRTTYIGIGNRFNPHYDLALAYLF